jgi:acetylornithine/N-succinyldiaminopimelate aminotransferase
MCCRAVSENDADLTTRSSKFSKATRDAGGFFCARKEHHMPIPFESAHALMDITERPPVMFVEGHGSWIWDSASRRYLDFVQGWAVNCLGHCPPTVTRALVEQAGKLLTPSPAFFNSPSLALADMLVRHSCFDQVFFANSGSEAIEGAIKLARRYGEFYKSGAYEIITFKGAFHGRTLAAMSASGKVAFDALFEPKVPGFPKAELNNIASVEQLIRDKTIAAMLEPIQGESGVWPATVEFLQQLRELTAHHGLLLIADEIQTGIGRTGQLFAYQNAAIAPDIMALGKGIGGGMPLAALLAKQDVSCFRHGDQGGTYNGNPLVCAAGIAVLQTVSEPSFLAGVREAGDHLMARLCAMSCKHKLGETRGRGLLMALDLGRANANEVVHEAMQHGLLINAPGPDTLRFMPALNVSFDEIDECAQILDRVCSKLA